MEIIKSTVQSVLESRRFIYIGFCFFPSSLISLYFCFNTCFGSYISNKKKYDSSDLLRWAWTDPATKLFSFQLLTSQRHYYFTLFNQIDRNEFIRKHIDVCLKLCVDFCFIFRSLLLLRIFSLRMAFRQTFQISIGNVNIWRARHFQYFRSFVRSVGRQIGNFQSVCLTVISQQSHDLLFFRCSNHGRAQSWAHGHTKIQAKQIKILSFFAFLFYEIEWDTTQHIMYFHCRDFIVM